ncbi:MAG: class I SAM-dependent methyltransferase [Rhizobiaceae bacterium]|nr:class I SAM-dependent methyltransferase [Rhizobiaceae bacterium]
MTALKQRIAALIAASGPMSVADYMAACLFDPVDGYYTTREPFGTAGDFVTAPEISQMFGELVAVRLYDMWDAAGRPAAPVIAEIGPGRGTLMRDMVRALQQLAPGFVRTARFELVETSPRLRTAQQATLSGSLPDYRWHETVATVPDGPLFIVGNELFDAIPMRQFVKAKAGWRERVVALDDAGALCFAAGFAGIDPALLPPAAQSAPEGAIFETAPAREALMDDIAARIAATSGGALFFDYGHLEPGLGDTLQALRRHAHDDPLAHPGEADLTSHVDFSALAAVARGHGLAVSLFEQGQWLLDMGLLARAGSLGHGKDDAEQETIRSAVERLAGPEQMGRLFKVMEITAR